MVKRYINKDNQLITKRLLVKSRTFSLPKWAEKFVQAKNVFVFEESICDPQTKTLTTYTRNSSMTSLMVNLVERIIN